MITAHKTDIGASRQGYAFTNGYALKIVGFCVGNGGHNPLNGNPITVNRNVSSLPGLIYGPVYNVTSSVVDSTTLQVDCFLRAGEAVGIEYSNIGLIAKVVDDSNDESEFLYAIANFALTTREEGVVRFRINLHN